MRPPRHTHTHTKRQKATEGYGVIRAVIHTWETKPGHLNSSLKAGLLHSPLAVPVTPQSPHWGQDKSITTSMTDRNSLFTHVQQFLGPGVSRQVPNIRSLVLTQTSKVAFLVLLDPFCLFVSCLCVLFCLVNLT